MTAGSAVRAFPRVSGEYGFSRLANGVRVVTERMPGVRSVAAGVWAGQGSVHETERLAGASHLLEHMVFRGTRNRTRREIAMALEGVGGSLNAYTSREHTGYEARALARHLPLAVEVLSDLVRHPLLRTEDLEHERKVVLEEIAAVEDTPDDLVFDLHGERMWSGHPYGRPILGSAGSVARIARDDLLALHRRGCVGCNLVVAAAGRVDHDDFRALAERWFGSLEAGAAAEQPEAPGAFRRGIEHIRRDSAQSHIVFGAPAPHAASPDRYPLLVLSAALGGGMSSRLFQRIREELALAYSVFSFQSMYARAGIFGVYLGTRPAQAAAALEAVRDLCEALAASGLKPDEAVRVREQVKGEMILALESPGARVGRLAGFALRGEPFLPVDRTAGLIDRVSGADLARVAAEVASPERQFALCLGPDPAAPEIGSASSLSRAGQTGFR